MKKKMVMATMALVLCGISIFTLGILPVKAEVTGNVTDSEETDPTTAGEEETTDFSKLAGFYLDSDTSFHMGNSELDGFFQKEEFTENQDAQKSGANDSAADQSAGDTDDAQATTYVLLTNKRYTGLRPLYNNSNWQGGYFYSDMTEDGLTVIVNCSASNDETFTGTPEEYRKQFAAIVSEQDIENYTETRSEEYTSKFTYPAYELSFTTGANEDTSQWKMLYFQTDTHTFAYAYKMDADFAEEMESEYKDAIDSLELTELLNAQSSDSGEDSDPSANGQSLEEFISYFDSWYQYGDLNATNIRLYGEGTWEIYNSKNADAGFERESESVAYEAQTAGEETGD